jgi:hypothetical protein
VDECPVDPWECDTCFGLIGNYTEQHADLCLGCLAAAPDTADCHGCFAEGALPDDAERCSYCVMAGVPGWVCQQYCAIAGSMDQMLDCTSCAANTDNPWGCFNCLSLVGSNDAARQACMSCVRAGVEGYACGQCAMVKKDTSRAKCFGCLSQSNGAGGDPSSCY